jgi:predicted nucleic acid-binding protein
LAQLASEVPEESITWVSAEIRRFYPEIMALIRDTSGALNFHDALIALGCRELDIQLIATFDNDFDYIEWLKRLTLPDDVAQALGPIQ